MNGINYMTHMNSNSNGYNYRSSYIQNTPSINQTNYTNKNTTLHNNLNENIELEQIEILNVLIDGYHRRNHTSEVNPYKFIVDFGQEPKLEETVGNITTKTLHCLSRKDKSIVCPPETKRTKGSREPVSNFPNSI